MVLESSTCGEWDEVNRLPIAREPAKDADSGSSLIGLCPVDAWSAVPYIRAPCIENPESILMFPKPSSSFLFPLGLLLLALSVCQVSVAEELKRVVERGSLERVEAVVEALNVDNRIVTLRSLSEDETVVMEVGDDVRNLAQVKVGDRVVVEFYQAVAVDLKKGGGLEETADQAVIAARAKPGDKPAGGVGEATEVVASILAIDRDKPSVTLKGPQGNVVDVIVRDPSKLVGVDVGDQVVITYTRAMAISVEPSPIQ